MFKFIRPEFFDIFGVFIWTFMIGTSGWVLKTGDTFPQWAIVVLLVIGILGLIVDGIIVYRTYIKKPGYKNGTE